MTNPTLDLIHAHGSVRRYKPDSLPASVIETLVQAGQRASTSSNMQAYTVIAVTEAATRARLSELCGGQKHVAEAPVFLTFCADLARLERACELCSYKQDTEYIESFLIAATDAVIMAQNVALAAESLGLGICYIGSIRNNSQEVIDLLGLPRLVFPVTGMTVGWPEKPPRIRPRLALREILRWEKYAPPLDEALLEYDKVMAATGIYDQRQVPVPGKPDEVEDYGWLEHTSRRVSKAVRTSLRGILEKQGFGLK